MLQLIIQNNLGESKIIGTVAIIKNNVTPSEFKRGGRSFGYNHFIPSGLKKKLSIKHGQ